MYTVSSGVNALMNLGSSLQCSCSGWLTGYGEKISSCQACCLAPAVPGCCLVSLHILWAILSTSTVEELFHLVTKFPSPDSEKGWLVDLSLVPIKWSQHPIIVACQNFARQIDTFTTHKDAQIWILCWGPCGPWPKVVQGKSVKGVWHPYIQGHTLHGSFCRSSSWSDLFHVLF